MMHNNLTEDIMKNGFTLKNPLAPLGRGLGRGVKAFTLAEVLITLGVIGVVSAMTLPTLIQNHQKQVTVTQLKKAYSEFAQALQKAEVEHGLMETWDFNASNFDNNYSEQIKYFGENYIFPYIKTVKICIPTSNECWADDIKTIGDVKKTDYFTNSHTDFVSFVTASGYTVYYWLHGTGTGMWYVVDVNGLKGPNKIGKDIFAFQANWGKTSSRNGVYPAGLNLKQNVTRENLINGDLPDSVAGAYRCRKPDGIGAYCTGVIVLDGWKIEKDYPW